MNTIRPGRVDLGLYTDRVGFRGELQPNASTLRALHLAHLAKIPFENIDVLQGKPISLNIGRLMDKLVVARRGGYCFEHNTLFAAVLESVGFRVSRLAVRLRFGVPPSLPRTHMALLVDAEGEKWLADVGYFGCGLLEPMPLVLDREARQGFRKLMFRRDGLEWVLRCQGVEQYSFTLEPHLPVDLEPINYYCSTHPEVPGNRELRVQVVLGGERRALVQRVLTIDCESGSETVELRSIEELQPVLRERFGLKVDDISNLWSEPVDPRAVSPSCPTDALPMFRLAT